MASGRSEGAHFEIHLSLKGYEVCRRYLSFLGRQRRSQLRNRPRQIEFVTREFRYEVEVRIEALIVGRPLQLARCRLFRVVPRPMRYLPTSRIRGCAACGDRKECTQNDFRILMTERRYRASAPRRRTAYTDPRHYLRWMFRMSFLSRNEQRREESTWAPCKR